MVEHIEQQRRSNADDLSGWSQASFKTKLSLVVFATTFVSLLYATALRAFPAVEDTDSCCVGPSTTVETALEPEFGERWRGLGVIRWSYNPVAATVFYFDRDEWEGLTAKRQEATLVRLLTDIQEYSEKQEDDREKVFVMIHDEAGKMHAAYSREDGLIEY